MKSKLDISLYNGVFLECKGPRGGRKAQIVNRFRKQPKCLQNKGKPNKTTIGLITWVGVKLDKNDYKTGEKRPKDK